jgi:hypothetical protein
MTAIVQFLLVGSFFLRFDPMLIRIQIFIVDIFYYMSSGSKIESRSQRIRNLRKRVLDFKTTRCLKKRGKCSLLVSTYVSMETMSSRKLTSSQISGMFVLSEPTGCTGPPDVLSDPAWAVQAALKWRPHTVHT